VSLSHQDAEHQQATVIRPGERRTVAIPRPPVSSAELGDPVAYAALTDGTPVYDRGRNRIGVVEQVVAVGGIFEGLVVHTYPLPGRHVYVRAEQIAEMREHGVLVSVPRDQLPSAVQDRGHRSRRPRAEAIEAGLRRAWDWITGQT
jgi:hypothetical protein